MEYNLIEVIVVVYIVSNLHSILRFCKKKVIEFMIRTGYTNIDEDIKVCRNIIISGISGTESITNIMNYPIELNGWSEYINENISDYDVIIRRMAIEKRITNTTIDPGVELALALMGSAFQFHLTNTLFKPPKFEQILRERDTQFVINAINKITGTTL